MSLIILYGIVLITLFILAYITRRRFGVLGLSLAAGSVLSGFWTHHFVDQAQANGISLTSPLLVSLVGSVLVLLPAILLLSSGPTYRTQPRRIIGAFLFSCLAMAFLVEPLQSMLVLQGDVLKIYNFFIDNRVYIITIGLVLALIDLLLIHNSRESKIHGKH